jgi:hypothetical protein
MHSYYEWLLTEKLENHEACGCLDGRWKWHILREMKASAVLVEYLDVLPTYPFYLAGNYSACICKAWHS